MKNQIQLGFEKARQIDQILQADGREIFKAAFSSPGRARTKAERKMLLDFWKVRKQQVITAVEASQPIPELKIPLVGEKADFCKKSRLKGKAKVAVRNARRNKLRKKYGLLAYKHLAEKI